MDKQNEQFQPELVEEQIIRHVQSTQQHPGQETPDERMIQDLQSIYTTYTQSGQRVWTRLSAHLAPQDMVQPNTLHAISDVHTTELYKERTRLHPMVPTKESHDLHTQRTTSTPRKSKNIMTMVASLLVAAGLLASAFMIIRTIHQPDKTTVAASNKTVTSTPSPQNTLPASDCLQLNGLATWNALCNANQVIAVNQSVKLSNGITVAIHGAYADHTQILIRLESTPFMNKNQMASMYEQMATAQGISLQPSGIDTQYYNSPNHTDWIEGFYTSTLPVNLSTLDLKLTTTIHPASATEPDKSATGELTFSVPMYHSSIIQPHQTVTTDGVAITLDSVATGATGTHMVFSAPQLPHQVFKYAFSCTLQNGQQHLNGCGYQNVKNSRIEFVLNSDLTQHHGAWTLTVTSDSTGQSWVYHFKS